MMEKTRGRKRKKAEESPEDTERKSEPKRPRRNGMRNVKEQIVKIEPDKGEVEPRIANQRKGIRRQKTNEKVKNTTKDIKEEEDGKSVKAATGKVRNSNKRKGGIQKEADVKLPKLEKNKNGCKISGAGELALDKSGKRTQSSGKSNLDTGAKRNNRVRKQTSSNDKSLPESSGVTSETTQVGTIQNEKMPQKARIKRERTEPTGGGRLVDSKAFHESLLKDLEVILSPNKKAAATNISSEKRTDSSPNKIVEELVKRMSQGSSKRPSVRRGQKIKGPEKSTKSKVVPKPANNKDSPYFSPEEKASNRSRLKKPAKRKSEQSLAEKLNRSLTSTESEEDFEPENAAAKSSHSNPLKGKSPAVGPKSSKTAKARVKALAKHIAGTEAGKSKDGDDDISDSDESESDWEEVEEIPESSNDVKSQIPAEPVEITLEAPTLLIKKRKKKEFDMQAWFQRQMKRYQRETQRDVHKVHLLCLLAKGFQQNSVCNSVLLQGVAFSLVPVGFTKIMRNKFDLDTLVKVKKWFMTAFFYKDNFEEHEGTEEEQICSCFATRKVPSLELYVYMFVNILRALGLLVRMVVSLQPVPLKVSKADQDKRISKELKKNSKEEKTSDGDKKPKTVKPGKKKTTKKQQKPKSQTTKVDVKETVTENEACCMNDLKQKRTVTKSKKPTKKTAPPYHERSRRFSSKVNYKEVSEDTVEDDTAKDPDVVEISSDGTGSDFESSQTSFRSPPSSSKKKMKIVSSESEESVEITKISKAKKSADFWIEVYIEKEQKWICVDCGSGEVNKPESIESSCKNKLSYAVAFDNNNHVKDVTKKYASNWQSQTRKLRVEADWWDQTLAPYKSANHEREEREESLVQVQLMNRPLPTSAAEYKNNPLYVLKKHLLKFEAIYPNTAVPVGYFKGEPVYARECVHTLHTRQTWLKEARVVRIGEEPYKLVKGRQRWRDKMAGKEDPICEIFGRWQTEEYIPPPAVDGKVPRNEYGNVELFKPSMLPGGTVHLQIPGLHRVAKKLDIDCVPAMIGFDTHCGWSHPVLDGYVVCEEFKDILLAAYDEDQEIQREKEAQKKEQRVMKNWKLLVNGLLIREKLKRRFDLQPAASQDESKDGSQAGPSEKATDLQLSWPLNRQEEREQEQKKREEEEKAERATWFHVEQM